MLSEKWFKAALNRKPIVLYFKAADAGEARGIAKSVFEVKTDAGISVVEIDADDQPELVSSRLMVNSTMSVGGVARQTISTEIFFPKST